MTGRLRVLWRRTLASGHAVQVVADERGRKQIEIVGCGYGADLETEGGEECIRFELRHPMDASALISAIEEVGQSGREISELGEGPSTGPKPGSGG